MDVPLYVLAADGDNLASFSNQRCDNRQMHIQIVMHQPEQIATGQNISFDKSEVTDADFLYCPPYQMSEVGPELMDQLRVHADQFSQGRCN